MMNPNFRVPVGQRVQIVNLPKSDLNGFRGVIRKIEAKGKNPEVEVNIPGRGVVIIKSKNLQPL